MREISLLKFYFYSAPPLFLTFAARYVQYVLVVSIEHSGELIVQLSSALRFVSVRQFSLPVSAGEVKCR